MRIAGLTICMACFLFSGCGGSAESPIAFTCQSLPPTRPKCKTLFTQDELHLLSEKIKCPPDTLSRLLHLVRLPDRVIHEPRRKYIDELLNGSWCHSHNYKPAFEETRYGVRCRTTRRETPPTDKPVCQTHRDQTLAVLASLGVSTDTMIAVGEKSFTVTDLLKDSLANFDIGHAELEWTTAAYCRYLPPKKSRENKHGALTTFDDLADDLMKVNIRKRSCGGQHVLHSLTELIRFDETNGLLSSTVRQQVLDFLARYSLQATERQTSDGSWHSNWTMADPAPESPGDIRSQVLQTGHMVEWLLLLPEELQPPTRVYEQAGRFLELSVRNASRETILNQFCPYSHAVGAVDLLVNGSP